MWMKDINGLCWTPCLTVHSSSLRRGNYFTKSVNASKWPFPVCATQKNSCSLPSVNLLSQKCPRMHFPNNKSLRNKTQSESCCLLKTRSLQTQCADTRRSQPEDQCRHQPRVHESENQGWNQSEGKISHPLWIFSVTCVMQGMSAIRADIFTNGLKNTRDRPLEVTSRNNTVFTGVIIYVSCRCHVSGV